MYSITLFFNGYRYDAELLVAQGYACPSKSDSKGTETSAKSVSDCGSSRESNQGKPAKTRKCRRSTTDKADSKHENEDCEVPIPLGRRPSNTRKLRPRNLPRVSEDAVCSVEAEPRNKGVKKEVRSGMRLRNSKTLESSPPPPETPISASRSAARKPIISKTEPETPSAATDVYDFNESEGESAASSSAGGMRPSSPVATHHEMEHQPACKALPGGRLKLTLRMKRSPVLDEVIESGSNMEGDGRLAQQQRTTPVYEVLRVEGLECESQTEEMAGANRVRRIRSRKSSSTLPASSPHSNVVPTTKRLRLIFGNESHTIDLPPATIGGYRALDDS